MVDTREPLDSLIAPPSRFPVRLVEEAAP